MTQSPGQETAHAIYANIDKLAQEITALQHPQRADISPKYGLTTERFGDYARHDLHQLAEAIAADNPSQFNKYIIWQRSMLRGHQVPDFFWGLNLETEQTALFKVLPPESHQAVRSFIAGARSALNETDRFDISYLEGSKITSLAKEYLKVLLAGDRAAAGELITRAVRDGIGIKDIYLQVFNPCLYEVGRLWQTGKITVADEHFFSAATQLIMSELYPQINRSSGKNGNIAIAACVSGELHEIGLRMVADLLELGGWRTFYLGSNMPILSIVDMIKGIKAQLLVLSMCLPINGPALREFIATTRTRLGTAVKIMIGGYVLSANPAYAASFGADGTAADAGEAVTLANSLVRG